MCIEEHTFWAPPHLLSIELDPSLSPDSWQQIFAYLLQYLFFFIAEIELDDSIIELSRHIGKDYKRLARALGIYKTDIEAIEYRDPRDLKEQIYEFFEFWKQKEGMNASVGQLMWGLEKAELSEVLEKMKTFTKGIRVETLSCLTVPLCIRTT